MRWYGIGLIRRGKEWAGNICVMGGMLTGWNVGEILVLNGVWFILVIGSEFLTSNAADQ